MEEADSIIFPILKDIGCQLPSNITSVKTVGEYIYPIASVCLRLINPDIKLDATLPTTKVNRFRLTTAAAAHIQQLGYPDEIGYQSFLYPNEQDIRKILIFLVDKLPKQSLSSNDNGLGGDDDNSNNININHRISNALSQYRSPSNRYNVFDLYQSPSQYQQTPSQQQTQQQLKSKTTSYPFHSSSFTPLEVTSKDNNNNNNTLSQRKNHLSLQQQYIQRQQPQFLVRPLFSSFVPAQTIPSYINTNVSDIINAKHHITEDSNQNTQQQQQQQFQSLINNCFKREIIKAEKISNEALQNVSSQYQHRSSQLNTQQFIDNNKNNNGDSSVFSRKAQFSQATTVAVTDATVHVENKVDEEAAYEALVQERQAEMVALQRELDKLYAESANIVNTTATLNENITKMQFTLQNNETALKDLHSQIKTRKRILDFLPNAEENIAKLKQLTEDNIQKILELNNKWELTRLEFVKDIQDLENIQSAQHNEYLQNIEKLQNLEAQIKQESDNIHQAEERYKNAETEYNGLSHETNRNVYMKRIMDIVKNIDKQNEEISVILTDIANAKREITNKTESVGRSFNEADDLIYSYAKEHRSVVAISIYKDIVNIRDGFETIIHCVEETGKKQTAIQNLQQNIDLIEERGTTNTMGAVMEDLAQIKQENKELKQKLQQHAQKDTKGAQKKQKKQK